MSACADTGRRTVVVAVAGRHGESTSVVSRLAEVIDTCMPAPWDVRIPDLADLVVLDDAAAVVLGSAVHLGHWLRPALRLRRQAQGVELLGLWLFSIGTTSHSLKQHPLVVSADDLVTSGRAIEHRVFASSVDLSESVGVWGRSIAAQIATAGAGTDVPSDRVGRPCADPAEQTTLRSTSTIGSRTP